MTESNTNVLIKIFNPDHLIKQTALLKESTVHEKIQWILGVTDLEKTQKDSRLAHEKTQKEYKESIKLFLGIVLFGVPLGLLNNILADDLTNLGGLAIFGSMVFGSIILSLTVLPSIKKRLKNQKVGGVYHYIKEHPTADFDRETFDIFKSCINEGRNIELHDTYVSFDTDKFNTRVDFEVDKRINKEPTK